MYCYFLWPAVVCAIAILTSGEVFADNADGFKPLFNEQDLAGWVLVNTPKDTWTVQDGMLVCSGKPVGEIRTEKMYQNFITSVSENMLTLSANGNPILKDLTLPHNAVPLSLKVSGPAELANIYGKPR